MSTPTAEATDVFKRLGAFFDASLWDLKVNIPKFSDPEVNKMSFVAANIKLGKVVEAVPGKKTRERDALEARNAAGQLLCKIAFDLREYSQTNGGFEASGIGYVEERRKKKKADTVDESDPYYEDSPAVQFWTVTRHRGD